ncbi:adenosine receptor A2a-like [Centruroides vittatus]|uniref:adenosine receptor A2a-like n=1 Tax=Centruroides vittatus TaxID=120091 RepID=UPI00350F0CCC
MNNTTEIWIPNTNVVTYITFEVIVAIIATIGNLLILVAFCVEKKLRKLTNYYILSLTIADLLVGLVGIPSAILVKIGLPMNAFTSCLMMLSLLMVLCTVSIFNLVAVSLDRYWAILHPFKYYTKMSNRAATVIIIVCWLLGSIIGFLPLFGWNNGPKEDGRCVFIPTIDYNFLVLIYFGTIIYPGSLMAYFYFKIYSVIISQIRRSRNSTVLSEEKKRPALSQQNSTDSFSTAKNKIRKSTLFFLNHREISKTKGLSIIVLVFMLCWIPLYTANCILAFCKTCKIPLSLMEFFIVLSHANSAINPFLYAYQMKDFQRIICNLIRCKTFEKRKIFPSTITTETMSFR